LFSNFNLYRYSAGTAAAAADDRGGGGFDGRVPRRMQRRVMRKFKREVNRASIRHSRIAACAFNEAAVGRYKLNSVYPRLKAPGFNHL
jgi:hypothetical protein